MEHAQAEYCHKCHCVRAASVL